MAQARTAALQDTSHPEWSDRLQERATPAARSQARQTWRRRLLLLLGVVVAAAALTAGGWWYLVSSHYISTDDAYVGASVADITPLIHGPVKDVRVHDTEAVHRGDVLVVIDPADEQIAVAQAQANYAEAQRRVRQAFATADAARAQLAARSADLKRAELDFGRREALSATGAVSGDELTMARNALDNAHAGVAAAQQELAAQLALVQGGSVDSNPEVQAARAALDAAHLALARTVIRAPIDGIVAQSQVQTGQRVEVGMTLMTVVPLSDVYVDANFKEGELRRVRAGAPVTLTSDLYGSAVVFHGRVVGVGGGTGSAFAMIPAQNATGNWIKVVQRLPVRIALDPQELAAHPLRVGLSMAATVAADTGGPSAAQVQRVAARTAPQANPASEPPASPDAVAPLKADDSAPADAPVLKASAEDRPVVTQTGPLLARAAADAGVAVQVGAFRTQAQAEAARQRFTKNAAGNGREAVIAQADLGERGIWYRLELGNFASAREASAFCSSLKVRGSSCFVARQ